MRRVSDGLLSSHVGGRTWWSRQWLELIETGVDLRGPRGVRGRTLARDGNVGELDVAAGRVTARVSVGQARAFKTAINVPVIDDAGWSRFLDVLASQIRWTAAFASNRMPDDLAEAELAAGVSLWPDPEEMSWEDDGDSDVPGRHAIALHHAVGAAMEANPLLLATVRGRRADLVLAALRARRAGRAAIGEVLGERGRPVPPDPARFLTAGDLEKIVVHPREPDDPAALLDRLGLPPRVDDAQPLVRLVAAAADLAWRVAAGEGSSTADDELLLAELRALRMAGSSRVAEALGWDPDTAAEVLDRLFTEGRVLRTGTGERLRYRAT